MTDRRFRYVGPHVDDLHDGHTVEPGQYVTLTTDQATDPHNQQRIQAGLLIDAPLAETTATAAATDGAVELAAAHSIHLAAVQGTGADGRITKGDVETHIRNLQEETTR